MSLINNIAIALTVLITFGIFGTWLTGIQEQKVKELQQRAEIRISQIREECVRKLETQKESWARDVDKKVEEKSKSLFVEQETKFAQEKKILEDKNAELSKDRDKLQEKLASMARHFREYKDRLEGIGADTNKAGR